MANGNKVLVLGLDGMEPYTTKRMFLNIGSFFAKITEIMKNHFILI